MPEISKELTERFRRHAGEPDHVEPVIVTLRPGTDATLLERAGMRVAHAARARPIATGTVDARAFEAISRLDGVERIELERGDMRALEG